MRSTRSRSWTSLRSAPLPRFAADEGGGGRGHGSRRAGALARLLGLAPVPVPPYVFEVDADALRFGSFCRGAEGWELERLVEADLPGETFHPGPLGGPLRAKEAFDTALAGLIDREQGTPLEASLVLPDRWLRLLFTDLEEELGLDPGDDVLRFKLKKLVPFRVDDLRLRAAIVPAFPARSGQRLLLAFGVEQLLRDLEGAFLSRGVRIGQVASRSLCLMSLLRERHDRGLLVVNLEIGGYALSYVAAGVPYVVRYRASSADPGQVANVTQDLRILLGFLEEHLPDHGVDEVLVCGPPEAAATWVDLLRRHFDFESRPLQASDLDAAPPAAGVAWHRVAPLLAAATREVA